MALTFSVIIPAYNEERRLPATLKSIAAWFRSQGISFEIIVSDDGSNDRTAAIVRQEMKQQPEIRLLFGESNRGKGYAVRRGVLAAGGEFIIFTDSDLSAPISELPKLWDAVRKEGFDIAIGSRGMHESQVLVLQPWYRRLPGKVFGFLVHGLGLRDFSDTQCGFKLFRREAARKIFLLLKTRGFAFDVEVLLRAGKAGYRVKEVPVVWVNSPESKLVVWRDPLRMLIELFLIRFFRN